MYRFIGSLQRGDAFDSRSLDGFDEWNRASQLRTVETISLAINRIGHQSMCRVHRGEVKVNQILASILL